MKEEIKRWITGTFPPKPDNMEVKIINEKQIGNAILGGTMRGIELSVSGTGN